MMFVAPRWQMPGGFASDGLEPLGREPTPQGLSCRTNPSDRGYYEFERRSVGAPGLPARRALLKHIMALCIIIIEF